MFSELHKVKPILSKRILNRNKYRPKKRGKMSKMQRKRRLKEKEAKLRMKQQEETGPSSSPLPTPNDEYSTLPPTSTDEYFTFPSTSTDEYSTLPPTSTDDYSTFIPNSTDEYSTLQPTSTDENSTFPRTCTNDYYTLPPTSTNDYYTLPPTSTDEYSTSLPNPTDEYSAGPSNIKPPYKLKKSRQFVNVAFFIKSLQNLNNHGGDGCNFSDMHISGETKTGCYSGIQLSCNICLVTVTVWMDDPGCVKPVTPPPPPPPKPPSSAGTATVKLPIIAQKTPAKKSQTRYRKTPTQPPDPPVQQHVLVPRPLAESIISSQSNRPHQSMASNASKKVNESFIKQEIIPPEDVASSCKSRVPSSSAQPASVQLLFYVEPSGSAQNLDSAVNDLIVPDITPTEVLPVNLNLVKKEVETESQPMEIVKDVPRLVPMSETSLDRSKTLFASESLTKTGHFKDSSPVRMIPVTSSTKTYSKENRVKYFASISDTSGAKNSKVSSRLTSIIPQRSFQQEISNSKMDSVSQTANGESDKIRLNLENKCNTNS